MNKFLKLALVSAALSTTALAEWDLEVAGGLDVYSLSRSTEHTDNSGAEAVKTTYSTSGFLQDFRGRLSVNYMVAEDVYVGISSGVNYDMEFAGKITKKVGTADAVTDFEADAEAKQATNLLTVPVLANIKYDIAEVADNTNVYLTLRGGLGFTMDMATDTPKGYEASYLGGLVDAGLGVEVYGAQVEVFYGGQFLGGYTKKEDNEKNSTIGYSNHGIYVTLGYRVKDLF